MYCKRCKFYSFDHLKDCPKCGSTWEEGRQALHLAWLAAGTAWDTLSLDLVEQPAPPSGSDSRPDISADLDADLTVLDFSNADAPLPDQSADTVQRPEPSGHDDALDVSHIADLDFSLDFPESEPEPQHPSVAADPAPQPIDLADESFFTDQIQEPLPEQPTQLSTPSPAQPEEPVIHLDFSLDFADIKTSAQPEGGGIGGKRGELFIPELEEMLIPLEEPRPAAKAKPPLEIPPEDDFFLNFEDMDKPAEHQASPAAALDLELELELLEQKDDKDTKQS
ncbi:hypothetical protein MASR1M90_03990 [Desulfovibrionales bacterium]